METVGKEEVAGPSTTQRSTAILWAVLFGAGTTLLKKVGTRYIMGEKARLNWSDLGVAVLTGTLSYVSFRNSYDDDFNVLEG